MGEDVTIESNMSREQRKVSEAIYITTCKNINQHVFGIRWPFAAAVQVVAERSGLTDW